MFFTQDHLRRMLPSNDNIQEWYGVLVGNLPQYGINTKERIAAFMAQCAHESSNFMNVS